MQENTAKFIELGRHTITHTETRDSESHQEGLLNVSSIESVVPEGLTDCIITANGKEYQLNKTGYRDTVDKIKKSAATDEIKKNVSLEEFEKTVFEFTKALVNKEAPGNVSKRVFETAIELAQDWHEGSEARSKAFQKMIADLDEGNEPAEIVGQSYGSAGKRTY